MCRDRSPKEVLTLLSLVHGEVPGRNMVNTVHMGNEVDICGRFLVIVMVFDMFLYVLYLLYNVLYVLICLKLFQYHGCDNDLVIKNAYLQ